MKRFIFVVRRPSEPAGKILAELKNEDVFVLDAEETTEILHLAAD